MSDPRKNNVNRGDRSALEPDTRLGVDPAPDANVGTPKQRTIDMNMMTVIQARASGATIATMLFQQDHALKWQAALADFNAKLAHERSLPIDDPNGDDAVEAMCIAMDHLIEEVPAPNSEAVATKLALARERSAAFTGLFDDHRVAILSDLRRLAGGVPTDLAPTAERGSHPICEDEREIFVDLPDLRSGRTLEDALIHLDGVALIDPASYPNEWYEEIRDVGGTASANYPKEGERHLYAGQPCDAQEAERLTREAVHETVIKINEWQMLVSAKRLMNGGVREKSTSTLVVTAMRITPDRAYRIRLRSSSTEVAVAEVRSNRPTTQLLSIVMSGLAGDVFMVAR